MAKRKVAKRKTARKGDAAKAKNRKALWDAYRDLQKRADTAWKKFRTDVKRGAKAEVIIKDHNNLLLLLGECNYMARECKRLASKQGKKRR